MSNNIGGKNRKANGIFDYGVRVLFEETVGSLAYQLAVNLCHATETVLFYTRRAARRVTEFLLRRLT